MLSDAIVLDCAYLLSTWLLKVVAKKVVIGTLEDLESMVYASIISEIDVASYKDLPVIIKGCSKKPVPANALMLLIQKLQPVAKSIMYGEACSSVPLYKKK